MNYLIESKQSIVNLGYPKVIAALFYEKFGSKAPVFARWYKEYNTFRGEDPNWWSNISHGFSKINVIHAVRLYEATEEYATGQIDLETYNQKRSKIGFASYDEGYGPEEALEGLKDFVSEEFFNETFFRRNLVLDFLAGKIKDFAPYAKLPFRDANEEYEQRKIFSSSTPIKQYQDGWKWIDTGKKCDFIGRKMDNCGSVGLLSDDNDAKMLTLFDSKNMPHVVVVFSPNKGELSHVEGQAGSAPKIKYLDYVIDLAKTLGAKIDIKQTKSKLLKIKYLLNPSSLEQISSEQSREFFAFQLADGKSYYTDGYSVVPKEQTDSMVETKPTSNLVDKLKNVFNHYEKEKILSLNPGFYYASVEDLQKDIKTESLRRFIKKTLKESLMALR